MPINWQQYLPLFNRDDSQAIRNGNYITSLEQWSALPLEQLPWYMFDEHLTQLLDQQDNGEALVVLNDYLPDHGSAIILQTGGEAAFGAQSPIMRLRQSAADRLLQAENYLAELSNNRWVFKLTDAYRPMELQKQYFKQVHTSLQQQGFSGDELYRRTTSVISDPALSPPHTTGGTVDLTVMDRDTQMELDFGTKVDEIDHPFIFTFHPEVSPDIKQRRAQLYAAMIAAGFVNCANEWWHYSYGNSEWALRTQHSTTLYAPL